MFEGDTCTIVCIDEKPLERQDSVYCNVDGTLTVSDELLADNCMALPSVSPSTFPTRMPLVLVGEAHETHVTVTIFYDGTAGTDLFDYIEEHRVAPAYRVSVAEITYEVRYLIRQSFNFTFSSDEESYSELPDSHFEQHIPSAIAYILNFRGAEEKVEFLENNIEILYLNTNDTSLMYNR
eukprot:UN29937